MAERLPITRKGPLACDGGHNLQLRSLSFAGETFQQASRDFNAWLRANPDGQVCDVHYNWNAESAAVILALCYVPLDEGPGACTWRADTGAPIRSDMTSKKHIELVEALNGATTESEHREARERLSGFREGLTDAGVKPDIMGCDLFYLNQGIERPACGGEFLDWKPQKESGE